MGERKKYINNQTINRHPELQKPENPLLVLVSKIFHILNILLPRLPLIHQCFSNGHHTNDLKKRKGQLLRGDHPRKYLSRTNKTQAEGVSKGSNPVSYKISSPKAPGYNHSTDTKSHQCICFSTICHYLLYFPCLLLLLSQYLPLSYSSHLGFSCPCYLWLLSSSRLSL